MERRESASWIVSALALSLLALACLFACVLLFALALLSSDQDGYPDKRGKVIGCVWDPGGEAGGDEYVISLGGDTQDAFDTSSCYEFDVDFGYYDVEGEFVGGTMLLPIECEGEFEVSKTYPLRVCNFQEPGP